MESANTIKMILVGDGGVGKTTFVKRHLTGEYVKDYNATAGAETHTMSFYTTKGQIDIEVWDTAGQEKSGTGINSEYYEGADCAIIMFDVTSMITYQNVPKWFKDIVKTCGNIPITLVGNKVDDEDRKLFETDIGFHKKKGISYFDVSAKDNFNIGMPFVSLLRTLTG